MADNPYINKVIYGDETLIDLTDATATAADIAQGATAYGATGELLTGTATGGGRCTYYGTCSTAAATAKKEVVCEGYTLAAGNIIAVHFAPMNSAASPTLDVNSTGEKSIYIGNVLVNGTTNPLKWAAQTTVYFMYDGSAYRFLTAVTAAGAAQPLGAGSWYGTSSTAATTQTKDISCTAFRMTKGAIIAIRFSAANTYTAGALKLNVNSTGAKTVRRDGANTSTTNTLTWDASATLLFMFDGTYYCYLCGADTGGGGSYTLPTASTSTKGGVKVPDDYTLLMDGEVLKIACPNYTVGIDPSVYASTYAEVLGVLTALQVPVIQEWLEVGDPNSPTGVGVTHAVKDVVVDDVGDGQGLITLFFEKYDSAVRRMMTYCATVSEEDDSWDVSPVSYEVQMV